MAKGLKMFFARQSKNDDQLVSISAITKDSTVKMGLFASIAMRM
nr:hypothetical protein [Providencia rettgeri]